MRCSSYSTAATVVPMPMPMPHPTPTPTPMPIPGEPSPAPAQTRFARHCPAQKRRETRADGRSACAPRGCRWTGPSRSGRARGADTRARARARARAGRARARSRCRRRGESGGGPSPRYLAEPDCIPCLGRRLARDVSVCLSRVLWLVVLMRCG